MIPHPLTLLFCWLLGKGLSNALGYVLEFAGELCSDAVRFGWAGSGFMGTATLVLAGVAAFAGGLFTGAAMRLLAERSWPKAAGWAILTCLIAAILGGFPRIGLALTSGGCLIGAWLCDRFREERWLDATEEFLRYWMFWERGGRH